MLFAVCTFYLFYYFLLQLAARCEKKNCTIICRRSVSSVTFSLKLTSPSETWPFTSNRSSALTRASNALARRQCCNITPNSIQCYTREIRGRQNYDKLDSISVLNWGQNDALTKGKNIRKRASTMAEIWPWPWPWPITLTFNPRRSGW